MWSLSEQYKEELEEAITAAIAPGTSAVELAAEVKKYLKEPKKRFRRIKEKVEDGTIKWHLSNPAKEYHPGQGVYRSSARNAQRLARTEINMAYRTAEQERWKQFDFVVGYEVKTTQNGHHKDDICDRLAGKYPKDFKFTGWHPQCMCYCIPILKTEEEFWAYDPENPQKSANEITELPPNFREWINDNRERIEAAEKRGKLPYFIRDNREDVEKVLNLPQYSEYRGNVLARTLDDMQTHLISRQFNGIESYEELSDKATKLLLKAVGNEVKVNIEPTLMPLDVAKTHLTELLSITKEYRLIQGRLTEIKLGYSPKDKTEYGVTSFTPTTGEKKVSLTDVISHRDSNEAIDNSRCEKSRLQFSLASHEGGHLLFSYNAPQPTETIWIQQSIREIWESYQKEFYSFVADGDMDNASKIFIGKYGHNSPSEFMAECFQEYRNCNHPSKYAVIIGKLLDSYFKK